MSEHGWVRVWDPFVRVFHWTLAVAFAVSYLTGDEVLGLHVWSGYLISVLIVSRAIWGVVGPQRARFSDFVYGPAAVFGYLRDLVLFRAPRHLGHSPAGGAMVVALMLSLAATCVTGASLYAVRYDAGPFASFLGSPTAAAVTAPTAAASDSEHSEKSAPAPTGTRRPKPGGTLKSVHELLANFTLALVIAHLAGVALASLVHRENLPRSMVTGLKRPEREPPPH